MPNWIIDAPDTGNDRWNVLLYDIPFDVAEEFLKHLEHEPSVPNGLRLRERKPEKVAKKEKE